MKTPFQKKLAVFIPAYNASKTLQRVFDLIPEKFKQADEVFVIDNASADQEETKKLVLENQKNFKNLTLHQNIENLGYGGSQKKAYQHCLDQGFHTVVMLHADGQYSPLHLESLVTPVLEEQADFVFGSRILGDPRKGGMPLIRYLGNRFLTTVQNILLGSRLSEFHSGYRVFRVEALKDIPFQKLSSDYHFDTEMIILFIRTGKKILEKAIPTRYADEENYVNIWSYGMNVLVTTGSYVFHCWGLRKSKNWSRILGE